MFLLLVFTGPGPGAFALDRLFAPRNDAERSDDRAREQASAVTA